MERRVHGHYVWKSASETADLSTPLSRISCRGSWATHYRKPPVLVDKGLLPDVR
jgi:hypothetical protein